MTLETTNADVMISRSRRQPDLVTSSRDLPLLPSESIDYAWWPDDDGSGFDLQSNLGRLPAPAGERPDAGRHTLPVPDFDAVFGAEPSRPFDWAGRRYHWEVQPRWAIRDVTESA